jgi:hypothetical protein
MKYIKYLLLLTLFVGKCLAQTAEEANILLIINYNFAHYESIPLLREIYSAYFADIVFYGPEEYPEVHVVKHHKGYLSYLCIADAMKRYPNFDGYLFLMDDCILNVWLVPPLDATKVWLGDIPYLMNRTRWLEVHLNRREHASPAWWWWLEWGYEATLKSYHAIAENYRKMLEINWGPFSVVTAYSDIVYIPAQYREQFLELAPIFGSNRVFLELALPTIISCFERGNNIVWLTGFATDRKNPPEYFSKRDFFNHPVKLSFSANKDLIRSVFGGKKVGFARSGS